MVTGVVTPEIHTMQVSGVSSKRCMSGEKVGVGISRIFMGCQSS